MIECRVPPEVARARLLERERMTHVSDGRLEILDAFMARMEPISELSAAEHLAVDTARPLAETIRVVERRLQTWPRGLCA